MGKSGCAVFKCAPRKSDSRHRFINPDKNLDLFNRWVQATGNKALNNLKPQYIYAHYRLCAKHFTEDNFIIIGTRKVLKDNALPTKYLPENVVEIGNSMLEEHSYTIRSVEESSLQQTEVATNMLLEHSYTMERAMECEDESNHEPLPSTSSCRTPSPIVSPETSGRSELLSTISAKSIAELTPKKKYLYKRIKYYQRQKAKLLKKNMDFLARMKKAKHFSRKDNFDYLTAKLSNISKDFFKGQLDCAGKDPKGRRFSLRNKITALALYKKSPAAYSLLSRIFALPSRTTLTKLIQKIPIKTGLCISLFEGLSKIGKTLSDKEKYCILIFDEMSLTPHLHYNQYTDAIEGFEDFGDQQTDRIADHVQVFMLRGVAKKWKQPILYHFVKGAAKATVIMKTVKDTIRAAKSSGFTVLATICDQGSNNVSAVKQLVEENLSENENQDFVFEVEGHTVIPLFDVPHLLKGVRNNLLGKDIHFTIDGLVKTARWEDIYKAWQLDNYSGELRIMPKLTDYHVNKEKIKKMKVSICSQVFSHTVSSAINLMANTGYQKGAVKMEKRATETAEFLKFMDSLFDSLNGVAPFNKSGKILKTAVKCDNNDDDNIHIQFWKKAKNIISSFHCYNTNNKKVIPPTFRNWQTTIANFIILRTTLKNLKFKSFQTRLFNQDPLENFFGALRQRGMRNVNPTSSAFGTFYKSLLVNNLVGKHSLGSNCEDDKSDILFPLESLIMQTVQPEHSGNIRLLSVPENCKLELLQQNALAYVAGYVTKKKLNSQNCSICHSNLFTNSGSQENHNFLNFVKYKEIGGAKLQRLKYVNSNFLETLIKMYNITLYILKNYCPSKNVFATIEHTLILNTCFEFKECSHSSELKTKIIMSFCKLLIFNFVNGVNNIIMGKDQRPLRTDCQIYIQARDIFTKRRRH